MIWNKLRTLKEHLTVLRLQPWSYLTTYSSTSDYPCLHDSIKTMTYTPQHIANYFLEKADAEGIPMSQLKLMKMVYIAYGWYIALTDKPLFDEPIEAWQHGPVIESLYHEFKHFKNRPIDELALEIDMDTFEVVTPRVPDEDAEAQLILSKVWVSYKRFKAWALRNKTHEKGGPWDKVYKKDVRGIELSNNDIKNHYIMKIGQYLEVAKIKTEAASL